MIPVDSVSNAGHRRHPALRGVRAAVLQLGVPPRRPELPRGARRPGAQGRPRPRSEARPAAPAAPAVPARARRRSSTSRTPRRGSTEVMRHGDYDAYWKQPGYSVVDNVDRYADVPVYHVTGWYDSWCRQNVMNWQALSKAKKSPQRLIVGPWTHGRRAAAVRRRDRVPAGGGARLQRVAAALVRPLGPRRRERRREGGAGPDLRHGRRRRPQVEGRPAAARRPLARGGGVPARADEVHAVLPARRRQARARAAGRGRRPTTYRFDPNDPVPTIGGNISSFAGILEPGGFDQRCRKDTRVRQGRAAALAAARRARLPDRPAPRGRGGDRADRGEPATSRRRRWTPTSPPS